MHGLFTSDFDLASANQPAADTRRASSIHVENLHRSFGADVALDGISLTVNPGEFFTLLGPSGCGKTTLLRLLAGLDEPDTGRIEMGGAAMAGVPPHQRSVNTVFQSYALFPHRDVRGNIAFGLEMRSWSASRVEGKINEIAGLIGIFDLLDRRVDQLSGGQRQRVALARALVNEPDVLLLDEPLSALDAGLRSRLQVELKRLQRQLGMTFVFVTHDQEEAMVMSDRIAVFNQGRVIQIGTPQEIYEQPHEQFVAQFMGHQNFVPITGRDEFGIDTLLGHFAGQFNPGDLLLLRPEALRLNTSSHESCHSFMANVDECLYRGGLTEYRLISGGLSLVAMAANQGGASYQPGERVEVTVSPSGMATLYH
ncbi:MAG: ABC transporter ATP-binding protein [Spiribacter sp.]|jgi:spermidine/putrescine transport system ATP-binding protein|nr:ABC transporter ATP-binding protein [Spiribacter sp.]